MFKKLWKWILLILIIIIAIYFPAILVALSSWTSAVFGVGISGAVLAAAAAAPWWVGAVIGLGLAYLVDPDTTSEIVEDVAGGAKDIIDKVVDVGADALESVTSRLWPWLLGIGAFFLLSGKRDDGDRS